MNICLFEDDSTDGFAPLTFTRAIFDLRVGSATIAELAGRVFEDSTLFLHCRREVAPSMARRYNCLTNRIPDGLGVLFLNSRWVPYRGEFANALKDCIRSGDARLFVNEDSVVAAWIPNGATSIVGSSQVTRESFDNLGIRAESCGESLCSGIWSIVQNLPRQIQSDFTWFSRGYNVFERTGAEIHPSAILVNGEHIFIGSGTTVHPGAVLDATAGPIVVAEDATIFEHAVIRGPAYIGNNARVHIGANIKSVALGDSSKVGGEVHDVIFHSYSNKAHGGFLGHSYIGQWCNLGAATNNSNLKNDYGTVTAYDYRTNRYESTGLQFAGLIMGDHSKSAIGTTFNTGTTIGVCCNLFGSGFHPRMVPSFCWGGEGRYSTYRFEKAVHVAEIVNSRRGKVLDETERVLLRSVFDLSGDRRTGFLTRF